MVFFNLSFFHGSRMSLSAQSRPSALAMPFYAIDMPLRLLEMAIRTSYDQPY